MNRIQELRKEIKDNPHHSKDRKIELKGWLDCLDEIENELKYLKLKYISDMNILPLIKLEKHIKQLRGDEK